MPCVSWWLVPRVALLREACVCKRSGLRRGRLTVRVADLVERVRLRPRGARAVVLALLVIRRGAPLEGRIVHPLARPLRAATLSLAEGLREKPFATASALVERAARVVGILALVHSIGLLGLLKPVHGKKSGAAV